MPDQHAFPPPGALPPPAAAPAPSPPPPHWPPAGGPAAWQPPPGMLGAAHKPGAIALRPLGLGDMYDGAFRIIRFNPKATVGSAVLVAAFAMIVPILVTAVLTWTVGTSLEAAGTDAAPGDDDLIGAAGAYGSLALGLVLQSFGLLLVTGMIAHVTAAAAVGRRLSLEEAWAATRGKRWRLVGLAVLLGVVTTLLVAAYVVLWVLVIAVFDTLVAVVFGVLSVPAFLAFMCWFWVRVYYLPVPALMLEPVGVLGAVARGFRLTRRQFWRIFGIALLTVLIAYAAGQVLSVPFTVVSMALGVAVGPEYAVLVLVAVQALSSVVTTAFVAPWTAAVTSLQYVDQRMRKEAYDVELMAAAGVAGR